MPPGVCPPSHLKGGKNMINIILKNLFLYDFQCFKVNFVH